MSRVHSLLLELQTKFKKFREEHHRRTRIPDYLRREVLLALDAGVTHAEIVKTLKIGSSQIFYWRKLFATKSVDETSHVPPRVLEVKSGPLPSGLRVSYEAGKWLLEISF